MTKRIRLKDYILYFLERLFLGFFIFLTTFIPIKYFYPLAEFIGFIGSYLFPRQRSRVIGNLNLAFGREKSIKEQSAIYRDFTINEVKNFFEMLSSVNKKNKQYLNNSIQILGGGNLKASLGKGKGVIAVGSHLGNFTLIGMKLKEAGYNFNTVVRGFTDPLRKNLYEKYRSMQDQSFIYTRTSRDALKNILQVLRKNEIILLITDENRRRGGVFVNFFNKKASTSPGPAVIHLRTGADILPIFLLRNHDNTHTLIIEPPLTIPHKGDHDKDVEEITQLITQRVEEYVRKYPAQWMWTQRRWRTRPPEEKAMEVNPAYRDY